MKDIIVKHAKEGNLKNLSVHIPRDQFVVLTGVSGSGKSTLAINVLFKECQRQYLEAMGMQGIQKPDVDSIQNVSAAILITQKESNKNPRSSVGTMSDIYTDLRMIFEKLGKYPCPKCDQELDTAQCREEVEKVDGQFHVYLYCNHCHERIPKLTRSHFSFNTREGACETCKGLGVVLNILEDRVVDEEKSLEDGAVKFWEQQYKEYQITALYNAFDHYGIAYTPKTKVKDYTDLQKTILLHGVECDEIKLAFPGIIPPKNVVKGKAEGVFPLLWRRVSTKGEVGKALADYFTFQECAACHGERLNETVRQVHVEDMRLPQLVNISLEELYQWVLTLEDALDMREDGMIQPYVLDIKTKIKRIMNVGLSYLSLNRQTMTLSGGEAQRIKLAATLDATLTGMLYILDEPTIGLHPKDTFGIIEIIKNLRDLGNTIVVIEHDEDVMKEADYIIDIGPSAGKYGGNVVAKGTYEQILVNPNSITGQYLASKKIKRVQVRAMDKENILIKNATKFNLKHVDVSIPIDALVCVVGVSGSGKSTLIFEVLAKNKQFGNENIVEGLSQFQQVICVEQSVITRMKRSNVATYSGIYMFIRKLFADQQAAKDKGFTQEHFSFNTKGGRCENCEGLGYVTSNMLFFEDIEVVCPICNGNQFLDDILSITYRGFNIKEVLHMDIREACVLFADQLKILNILNLLIDVGLGYLELAQTLTTLSGGEGQRLKLAKELISNKKKKTLYLIDEPTTGLHPLDVDNFIILLNRMVDAGNSVILVEHNQQIMHASDWVIELGKDGGINGGNIIAQGTPRQIRDDVNSVSGQYL